MGLVDAGLVVVHQLLQHDVHDLGVLVEDVDLGWGWGGRGGAKEQSVRVDGSTVSRGVTPTRLHVSRDMIMSGLSIAQQGWCVSRGVLKG